LEHCSTRNTLSPTSKQATNTNRKHVLVFFYRQTQTFPSRLRLLLRRLCLRSRLPVRPLLRSTRLRLAVAVAVAVGTPRLNAGTLAAADSFDRRPPSPKPPPLRLPKSLPLRSLKPYLLSQSGPVLLGWLCGAVSALSLSKLVPRIGKFSSDFAGADVFRLRGVGFALGVLLLARAVSSYLQHAFLWDAALNTVYRVRVDAFERVLERDLGFFEGGGGVSAGDIAYRITAEASDVADTIYALLNVSNAVVMLVLILAN